MLSHKKSLNILRKTNALLEGHFILSSGLHSSKYIQCAKLLSFPRQAQSICQSLANKIKKKYKQIDHGTNHNLFVGRTYVEQLWIP